MITPQELNWIKNSQREFEKKFNKKLSIDFFLMKEIKVEENGFHQKKNLKMNKNYIDNLLKKHNLRLNHIISPNSKKDKLRKAFLIEYSKMVMEQNWDIDFCGEQLNLDRTSLYYYSNIELYSARRKKYTPVCKVVNI